MWAASRWALFPDSTYEETSLPLQTGDVLVFDSDGVIEMRNAEGDEFGLKRLAETVRINHEKKPDEIVKSVSAALADFIGRVRPHDDRTMVVVTDGRGMRVIGNWRSEIDCKFEIAN